MLPKSKRLTTADFSNMRGARTLSSPDFIVRVKETGAARPACCAVVVSKDVDTRAVVRNSIRRQVYSALRAVHGTLKGGLLITVSVRKTPPEFPILERELTELFSKNREIFFQNIRK